MLRFLENDNILVKTYKKYKNQLGYIRDNDVNKFINEALLKLPKNYISEIITKNNTKFLSDLQNIN